MIAMDYWRGDGTPILRHTRLFRHGNSLRHGIGSEKMSSMKGIDFEYSFLSEALRIGDGKEFESAF